MKKVIMMACTFFVAGAIINGISVLLKSPFICTFLEQNLILILVAILAINTTTLSVILTKMREIADKNAEADFKNTRKSMRQSTIEHLCLIGIAAIVQILKGSPVVCASFKPSEFIFEAILIGIFIYSIQILYDTAQSVYVILDYGH
ncbi:MAG: hypothetical protein PHP23_04575 [Desulfobacterales bacterium]|nr:hypothetical protein [Desulfobacterales bacterium]MDD4071681.1 hypothetical protein [Desulfobacterales bacterium]MDD4393592.1 hypothetical protein [Desulfobacterales bacterium]